MTKATYSNEPSTILIVEDEILIRLAVAEYLRDCGYKVFEACDVAEAKTVLEAELSVGLVFSDVQMPGGEDGFALATWIRQRKPDIQVMLTSGLPTIAEKARDLCHDGPVVPKPYEHEGVLQRVRELLHSAAISKQMRTGTLP